MRFADAIQRRTTVTEGRPGRKPIWFATKHESKGFQSAVSWLQKAIERYPNAITAVLCPSDREARMVHSLLTPTFGSAVRLGDSHSFSFDDGILVTSIAQVKGLEFMNVLVWNPSDRYYPDSQAARNALYIAVTRAEENVCLVTWKRPSPALPHIFSKLVRGIDLDIEEEEAGSATGTSS
jgi:DNA helicase IV